MNDSEIVALLVAGERSGLEQAYAAYADRIHDYATRMLRRADPTAAADVTHDTFLIAFAKAPDLRDPSRFRSWLYAIARNECLRVLKATTRFAPLEADQEPARAEGSPEMSPESSAELRSLADADLRALVQAAAAGLSPKDREVFDLGLRHDLDAREVAGALGVSDNAAHAMLSRVRTQFERSLGAFAVARAGRGNCPGLDSVLASWDGGFDPLWRKRIARHVDGCAVCIAVQSHELRPSALLAVFPLVLAPTPLRDRLFAHDLDLVSANALREQLGDEFGPDGFPIFADWPRARRRGLVALVLAALLVLACLGGVAAFVGSGDDAAPTDALGSLATAPTNAASLTLTPPPFVAEPRETFSPAATPTLTPTPSTTPTAEPSPTPTVTATPTPTTTPSPDPEPVGVLTVTPQTLTLRPGETGTITLTAAGAAVSWTATADPLLQLSALSGDIAEGESVVVVVVLDRTTPPGTPPLTATFSPGDIPVTVNVGR